MPETAPGQLHRGVHDEVVGHARPGTEPPGIALRPILLTGLFIVVFTAATLTGIRFYYRFQVPGPLVEAPKTFPAPRLQQNPEADLAALLKEQRGRLAGYAWVDREKGIARMPIEDAMRQLAGRGQAAYAAPLQPERVPPLGSRGGGASPIPSPGDGPARPSRAGGTP